VEREVSFVQPVQVGKTGMGQQVILASMGTQVVLVCSVCSHPHGGLLRYNENHDARGRFATGGGGESGGSSGGRSSSSGSGASGFDAMALSEKEAFLASHGGKEWEASLSPQEREALDGYTWIASGSGYETINKALRTGTVDEHPDFNQGGVYVMGVGTRVKLMTNALMRGQTPTEMTVYRTVAGDDLFSAFQSNVGRHFVERAFCSTTINSDFVRAWTTPGSEPKETTLHIRLPKGTPGGYLKHIASKQAAANMCEWLLPPNAKMRVERVYTDKNGFNHVHLTYVGQHQWGN
jgi:hypothetical protein